jgi:conjugal transfer pilin signal peptidase TrbI
MTRADAAPLSGFWNRARRRRYLAFAAAGLAFLGLSELGRWSERHALLVNASTSLPHWAFLIDREAAPERGDFIFFDPPKSALLERHFGADLKPFGKIVEGVAGDRIDTRGRLFLVNGRPIARAKPQTRRGEPLALGPTGIIPPGCYFVATPHPDSFDSRYAAIGWICRPRIVGVGEAIL